MSTGTFAEVAWHRNAIDSVKYFALLVVSPKRRLFNGSCFILATEGNTFRTMYNKFAATAEGRDLLRSQPQSIGLLADRAKLASCPERSLGRRYLEFMQRHAFDEGIYLKVNATLKRPGETGDKAWFRERWNCCHDLRHVLTGYGPDELGEICLLAFRYGQTGHLGIGALALLGLLHPRRNGEVPAWRAVQEAYRRGKASRLLDLLPWEGRLDQPLAEIRAQLAIAPPRFYAFPEFTQDYRQPL